MVNLRSDSEILYVQQGLILGRLLELAGAARLSVHRPGAPLHSEAEDKLRWFRGHEPPSSSTP